MPDQTVDANTWVISNHFLVSHTAEGKRSWNSDIDKHVSVIRGRQNNSTFIRSGLVSIWLWARVNGRVRNILIRSLSKSRKSLVSSSSKLRFKDLIAIPRSGIVVACLWVTVASYIIITPWLNDISWCAGCKATLFSDIGMILDREPIIRPSSVDDGHLNKTGGSAENPRSTLMRTRLVTVSLERLDTAERNIDVVITLECLAWQISLLREEWSLQGYLHEVCVFWNRGVRRIRQ